MPLHWHTEPLLVLTILVAGWLYASLTGPWRTLLAPGEPFPAVRAAWFYAGLAAGYLTVGSPLDALGESLLFSAHMVQHLLLTLVVPVMLVLGIPGWLADRLLRPRAVQAVGRVLLHPVLVGVVAIVGMTAWHVPRFYEAALHSKPIHVAEHLTMFVPSLGVWWLVLSPSRVLPALRPGPSLILVLLLLIGQAPLYGFLVLTDVVWYPTYEYAPRVTWLPLTPLEDQILGGLLMMAANIVAYLGVFGRAFLTWARAESARPARLPAAARPGSLAG